jgi:hypothetical protein
MLEVIWVHADFAYWTKVRNSTAQCPESEYKVHVDNLYLLDSSSVTNLTLALDTSVLDIAFYKKANEFRYCRLQALKPGETDVAEWNRVYFVEDVVYSGKIIQFVLSEDVMGMYRDRIRLMEKWVGRCYASYNPNLMDTFYEMEGQRYTYDDYLGKIYESDYSNGYYVVGIINSDENQVGAVTYYVFSQNGFKNFCTQIFGTGSYAGLDGSNLDIATFRAVFNPLQYITSAMYIPQKLTANVKASGEITTLKFGWYSVSGVSNCWRLNVTETGLAGKRIIREIYKNPAVESTGTNTFNVSPWMEISVYFPPFGLISIDTTLTMLQNYLIFETAVDPITGNATLEIYTDTKIPAPRGGTWLTSTQTKVGIDISLAQVSKDNYAIQSAVAQKTLSEYQAAFSVNQRDAVIGGIEGYKRGAEEYKKSIEGKGIWALGDVLAPFRGFFGDMSTGGPRIRAAVNAAGTIGNESIVKAQQPQVTTLNAAANSVVCNAYGARILYRYYLPAVPDYVHNGRLYNKFVRLMYVWGGYCQCSNVTFTSDEVSGMLPVEQEYIQQTLQTGCYLED